MYRINAWSQCVQRSVLSNVSMSCFMTCFSSLFLTHSLSGPKIWIRLCSLLQMWEYLCLWLCTCVTSGTSFNFILFGKLATRFLCFIHRISNHKKKKTNVIRALKHNHQLLNDGRRFRMFMCSITATFILCFRSIFNLWTRKTRHRFIRCCQCSGWNLIRMSILIVYNWLDENMGRKRQNETKATKKQQQQQHDERRINKRLITYKNRRCDIFYCFRLLFSCVNYPWFWSDKEMVRQERSINSTRKDVEQTANGTTDDDEDYDDSNNDEKKETKSNQKTTKRNETNLSNITCCVWDMETIAIRISCA